MTPTDTAQWRRRYWRLMEWQRFASRGSRCFTFPHPQSAEEQAGQAEAIRQEGRITRFAVQWVAAAMFDAQQAEQHRRCHVSMRTFDRARV